MARIIVAGIGTDVGKTLVSALICESLSADYWKPIECGSSDGKTIASLTTNTKIHPPTYSFSHPVSPHLAAQLEQNPISLSHIKLPHTERPLVIEMAGGIFTPLTPHLCNLDLFCQWQATWILVSRHYLGSINHTLLSAKALSPYHPFLFFNGNPSPATESILLQMTGLPLLGSIKEELIINPQTIQEYACQIQKHPAFGTLTHK